MDNLIVKEYSSEFEKKVKDFLLNLCISELGYPQWEDSIRNEVLESYKEEGGNFWIALDKESNIIGTIGASKIDGNKCCLKRMYVNKNYRGINIAQKLLNTLENHVKELKYSTIELHTLVSFDRAINFYKKNGFKITEDNGLALTFEKYINN